MTPQRPMTTPERLTALEKTAEHTHELIQDMHTRLFGKEQPGELQKLDTRVRRLEAYRWKLIGFFAACGGMGAAAGVVGGFVVHWLKS